VTNASAAMDSPYRQVTWRREDRATSGLPWNGKSRRLPPTAARRLSNGRVGSGEQERANHEEHRASNWD
jgi:hypothetical protein